MENTLLIGLSRQITLERHIGVIANNVANMNTTGFKADRTVFEEYLMPVARADNFPGRDRVFSYVLDRATFHDFAQGSVEQSGNPLDVAVTERAFIAVQTPAGERYTRDGALKINAQGQLVTNDGYRVVGDSGPIVFQPGDQDIHIAHDGSITVREGNNIAVEAQRGKMRLVTFAAPQGLRKEGRNLFSAPPGIGAQPATAETGGVRQGFIERSNVNSVLEMSNLIEAQRTYTTLASLMQQQTELRRSAIEKLAEVPT